MPETQAVSPAGFHDTFQRVRDELARVVVGQERVIEHLLAAVFANLLLGDEISRSPTRTRNALLEVMQERQVTVAGRTYFLPQPFILVATQNTLDTEGTLNLGEAQVDRFLMVIEQGHAHRRPARRRPRRRPGTPAGQKEAVTW